MQALALESKSTTLINNSFLIIALVSRSGLSKGNSSASLDATQSTVGVIDFSIRDQLLTAGNTIYCLIWGGLHTCTAKIRLPVFSQDVATMLGTFWLDNYFPPPFEVFNF